ncbi:hypothetical protein GGR51DRAFT_190627 [Nemania sp. FL0031]|nr:hypothetical protein GGR51DRAFT_190627 [Nemania sp. FL0031]
MLRGPATPPPSRLEAGAGAHHSVGSYATSSRHLEVYEPPTLTFEPREEGLSLRQTTNSTIESNNSASNYRQHQRQLSAPSFSDRRTNAPSPPHSRPQSLKHYSPAMPLTGDRRGGNSPGRPSGRPSGRSTPVEYDASSSSFLHQHQPRTPLDTTPKSAAAQSRLGFFASSVSAFTSRMTSPTQPPARTDDELCDLDIEAALYPAQSPLDGEAFSPAAYKNLQTNATGLLHRMQDAYRRRTVALREMQAEREARSEEMEEMELRTRNFKSQLESMAAKAAEQELAMQQLVAELQAERRARQEEQRRAMSSREKMFRVGGVGEEGSIVGNEDLCVDEDERKRWRASNSTVKSDISIDTTDADSTAESESIFSRSRSPTAMTCVTESESVLDAPAPSPSLPSLPLPPPPSLHPRTAALPKTKSAQQLTAFQRLVKGISTTKGEGGENHTGVGVGECRNCRGQDSSVAWNTVSLLRDENSGLKQRVAHLEVAVEGALDVINGIKI